MNNFWDNLRRPILALAPMEGVTDSAFRTLCREQGADVVYTEFMAAEALVHGAPGVLKKMRFHEHERPIVCQIFGKTPESFAIAAQKVQELGFDGIDLNFGCPARKVVRHGSGAALLRQPQYARQLIEVALEKVTIPLSIKVRSSIRTRPPTEDPDNQERSTALDLVDAISDLPVAAIMVHGRNFEQGHNGEVDTTMIRAVKQKFSGIVLANGGIMTPERARSMLTETSADGVGLARGTWGQPWIFSQARQLLDHGQYNPIELSTLANIIRRHAQLLIENKGDHGIIEFRKHLARYIQGCRNASQIRRQAVMVSSLADVEAVIKLLA